MYRYIEEVDAQLSRNRYDVKGEKRIHLKRSSRNDGDNILRRIVRRVKFMDNVTMRNVKDEIRRLNFYQETAFVTENWA